LLVVGGADLHARNDHPAVGLIVEDEILIIDPRTLRIVYIIEA
jgi:hypothetical protein